MIATLTDPQFLIPLLVAVAVFATCVTLAMPFLEKSDTAARMKSVALERDEIRARERARMQSENAAKNQKVALRKENNKSAGRLVDQLNLRKALADENTTRKLHSAGYRTQNALNLFLAARVIFPIVFLILSLTYVFVLDGIPEQTTGIKIFVVIVCAYLGFYLPVIFISNQIGKRKTSIQKAWPDSLDLMLICVESGVSIEHAMKRAAQEIAEQSPELAEEFVLTTAELSYLQDRRVAFENLGRRTDLDIVQAVCQSLIQSEKYGTPVAQALRVLAQESRDMRMARAEEKAAALPPKLTVPMILFFLPVLFGVVLGPAAIQVMDRF
ncbi:type II secretion system F family protein [Lentilitoribacter sp. EG35]|uniref:type II secretion system F family protein n=1 Tax=Lentilitoribacter sp. EG35 TaxID=3234192 RepID=UPI003460BA0C